MYQYRVTIEDRTHDPLPPGQYPTDWNELVQKAEARGMNAKLEMRSVFHNDKDLIACFEDPTGKLPDGFMLIGEMLITNWEYAASIITH